MKTRATLLTLMAGVGLAQGQGIIHNPGIVSFVNTETLMTNLPAGVMNHLIYDRNGISPLFGTNFMAELLQVNPDNTLTPIPSSLSRFKSRPGTWTGPFTALHIPTGGGVDVFDDGRGETFPVTGTGRYPVTLLVRAWDSGPNGTLDYASATNKGDSGYFVYAQTFTPVPADIQMRTQPGFRLAEHPLRITDLRTNGPQVNISFTTDPGLPYYLESKDALVPGPWTLVPGSARTGSGAVLTVPDTRPRATNRFYRAVITP